MAFSQLTHGTSRDVPWEEFFFFFSRGVVSVQYWGLRIMSLCFVHDVVQLASLDCDLECTLGCFAAECEATGMRVSASKSEALALVAQWIAPSGVVDWQSGTLGIFQVS